MYFKTPHKTYEFIDYVQAYIIVDENKQLNSQEITLIAQVFDRQKSLCIDKLFLDLMTLLIKSVYWYKEVNSKKYSRLRNKKTKELVSIRGLKRDGYIKRKSVENQMKLERATLSKKSAPILIIKVTHYEIFKLLKKHSITRAKDITDEVIGDLFNYRNLNPYKYKTVKHLGRNIKYST